MSAELEAELGDEVPTALYRLYDPNGELLYVGVTGDLRTRFAQHAATKPWWSEVAKKTVTWHMTRGSALAAESAAIRTEQPHCNVLDTGVVRASTSGGHKANPVCFRPSGDLRSWLLAYAEASSRSLGAIISEALIEYRERIERS